MTQTWLVPLKNTCSVSRFEPALNCNRFWAVQRSGLNSLNSASDLYFIINILNHVYGRVNFIKLVIFLLHIFLISNTLILVQFLIAIVFSNHINAFSPLLFHPPFFIHTHSFLHKSWQRAYFRRGQMTS